MEFAAASAGDNDAAAALDAFYTASIGAAPVRVVQGAPVPTSGKPRGKIVIATAAVARGEMLFRECPLVAMQSVTNKPDVVVCAHCHRFLGDIDYQADILTRVRSRLDIVDHGGGGLYWGQVVLGSLHPEGGLGLSDGKAGEFKHCDYSNAIGECC